jgi:poly(A) polymerase
LKQHPTYGQALDVVRQIKSAGHVVYFAGGCVRDGLLGREPQDLDLATNATPDQITELFPNVLGIGKAFGIMMLPLGFHQKLEIATFRKDGEYLDGRRPESIHFSSPEEDAKRRDFTVNALFYNSENEQVNDIVGGVQDLKKKIIRTVGDPRARFQEDQLRLLRAVRFLSQLDFEIEKETQRRIQELAPFVVKVAQERILEEIQKLMSGTYLLKGLTGLLETGLWNVLFLHWFQREPLPWDKHLQFETLDLVCEMTDPRSRFYWLLKASSYESKDSLTKLKLSQAWSDSFLLWESVEKGAKELPTESWGWTQKIYRSRLNSDFRVWLWKQALKPAAVELIRRFERFDQLPENFDEPLVKSQDLMPKGVTPGPQMGKLLKEAFETQLRMACENQKMPSTEDILKQIPI